MGSSRSSYKLRSLRSEAQQPFNMGSQSCPWTPLIMELLGKCLPWNLVGTLVGAQKHTAQLRLRRERRDNGLVAGKLQDHPMRPQRPSPKREVAV